MVQTITEVRKIISLPEEEYETGISSTKLTPSLVTAFVKGSHSSHYGNDVIGYYLNNDTSWRFWEVRQPFKAKQTFLGLRLLAECPTILDDTPCACFYVMSDSEDATVRHYLESLVDSGFTNAAERRLALLAEYDKQYSDYVENFLQPRLNKLSETKSCNKQEAV